MEFKCKKAGNECYGFKELVLLFDISQRLIQSKELKDDLSVILEMVVKYLGAELIQSKSLSKVYLQTRLLINSLSHLLFKIALDNDIDYFAKFFSHSLSFESFSQMPSFA